MGEKRELRPHQVEAVDAAVRALDAPPGGIPANGLRASVVMACGTGKTMVAAHSARRLVRNGRVLVLLPTLDLLTQTVREWRREGRTGPSVAVCSLDDNPELWAADVRTTTNALRLAMWHKAGPVTVYATYASLPVLAAALNGAYGQRMAPFDLAVVDEAHRTSGALGKAWAAVHQQSEIPAARRLYLTATPRVWQERPAAAEVREGARERLPAELACSMDDVSIFGPVVYELGLADAISMGLLARYQVVVVEITDPELPPDTLHGGERREEKIRGLRLGALQGALLRTAADHELGKIITFHHRTVEAEAFSAGLGAVAARMHRGEPDRYPAKVWAGWLRGEHEAEHRAQVLGSFGGTAHRAVLSNCRVLGEGVDCPAVDSVALLDPKGSPVDIVQAIGRALRQKPGAGKMASLVVPVFLGKDEKPEDMATSASYKPLVKVMEGLRAHDERAVEMLAIPQLERGESTMETVGPEPEEGEDESRMLLRFSAPRNPLDVAEWVLLQVIDTERHDWARGYAAARDFAAREGHLRVPPGHIEARGSFPLERWVRRQRVAWRAGEMPARRAERLDRLGLVWDPAEAGWSDNLAAARAYFGQRGTLCAPRTATALERSVGKWLDNQRTAAASGALRAERAAALAEVDPDWNPGWDLRWQRHYAALAQLVEGGGTLGEIVPGVTVYGQDIGRWLARQQQDWARLAEGQQERLRRLGVKPAAPEDLGESGGAETGVRGAVDGVAEPGVGSATGGSAAAETAGAGGSAGGAAERAEGPTGSGASAGAGAGVGSAAGVGRSGRGRSGGAADDVVGARRTGAARGAGGGARGSAWARNLRAAAQYRDRVGTLAGIPRGHVETVVGDDGREHAVKLGVWIMNQRSRRATLPADRAAALAELDAW